VARAERPCRSRRWRSGSRSTRARLQRRRSGDLSFLVRMHPLVGCDLAGLGQIIRTGAWGALTARPAFQRAFQLPSIWAFPAACGWRPFKSSRERLQAACICKSCVFTANRWLAPAHSCPQLSRGRHRHLTGTASSGSPFQARSARKLTGLSRNVSHPDGEAVAAFVPVPPLCQVPRR
jgi:hypothetical protein